MLWTWYSSQELSVLFGQTMQLCVSDLCLFCVICILGVIWTLWAATYLLCAIRCKLRVYSARSSLMVFWPGNASLSSLCCRKANWILRNTIVAWNWLTYDFTNHVLTCNAPINVSSLFAVKTARRWSLLALYGALHVSVKLVTQDQLYSNNATQDHAIPYYTKKCHAITYNIKQFILFTSNTMLER